MNNPEIIEAEEADQMEAKERQVQIPPQPAIRDVDEAEWSEVNRNPAPGGTIATFGDPSTGYAGKIVRGHLDAKGQPLPADKVRIYDREGYPSIVPFRQRYHYLSKLDKDGKPVFFKKPPKQPQPAPFACPREGCIGRFHDQFQLNTHIKNKHKSLWREREYQKEEEREARMRRMEAAQEATLQKIADALDKLSTARRKEA